MWAWIPFQLDYTRSLLTVAEIWLPSVADINLSVKVLLVNPRKVSPEAQTALRHYLLALPASSEGKQQLDRIGLPQGFAPLENRALLDAHGWLQRGLLNAP